MSVLSSAVLIPVKSFDVAKGRLAEALPATVRTRLAEAMAATVVRAAGDLPVWIVCDDDRVVEFAEGNGAKVIRREARGLNQAVRDGMEFLTTEGYERVVIAHGDLPLAKRLDWVADFDGVTIVPDRRNDGTNVMCVPTGVAFDFHYGVGSNPAHQNEAQRRGLSLRVAPDANLGWDIDTPEDLSVLPDLFPFVSEYLDAEHLKADQ